VPVRTQDVIYQEVRAPTLQTFSRAILNFTPFVPGTIIQHGNTVMDVVIRVYELPTCQAPCLPLALLA